MDIGVFLFIVWVVSFIFVSAVYFIAEVVNDWLKQKRAEKRRIKHLTRKERYRLYLERSGKL